MNLKDIQNLIKFVAKSGASEVKLEMEDIKITIRTGEDGKKQQVFSQVEQITQTAPAATPNVAVQVETTEEVVNEESKYITVKSPIIGTFYRKPSQINQYLQA